MRSNNNRKRYSRFNEAVISAAQKDSNTPQIIFGENGCPEFSSTGCALLSLSQLVRGSDPSALCDQILSSSSIRDVSDLIILAFVTRNIRGGKGEKDLSYAMFLRIWYHYPETAKKLLPLFANHYGYWKDFLLLTEKSQTKKQSQELVEPILEESINLMRAQFQADLDALAKYEAKQKDGDTEGMDRGDMEHRSEIDADHADVVGKIISTGPKISLLAKWLPRENTYFDKKLNFIQRFLNEGPIERRNGSKIWKSHSKKSFRKEVKRLTSFLSLPEVYLSAQRADEIKFHMLSSKATLKLSRALLNEKVDGSVRRPNDAKRQRCAELFVDHLTQKGLKGSTLMPDEIVAKIMKGKVSPNQEKVLDAQWKDLWNTAIEEVQAKSKLEGVDFDPSKMVPLSDVSGSMSGKPMEVAIAMGIGISEITHPAFRDMVLTFESTPCWHKLNPEDSIVKKVRSLMCAGWGGSTNFERAYDQIMKVCVEHRLAKKDVPSLIVFSDMQFDLAQGSFRRYGACYDRSRCVTMHETIRSKFATTAQILGWKDSDPTPIVYWNLRDTCGHPVEKDTEGTVLLSGFSPSMLKMVMTGEALEDKEVEVVDADGAVRTEKVRVTPAEILRKILDDSIYDPVREILVASKEGLLKHYDYVKPQWACMAAGSTCHADCLDEDFKLLSSNSI